MDNLGYYKNIDKIYVLGDIHGDLNKFLSFLKSIKIIKSSSFPDDYDVLISNDKKVLKNKYFNFKIKIICLLFTNI